jgi:hypothetical protein
VFDGGEKGKMGGVGRVGEMGDEGTGWECFEVKVFVHRGGQAALFGHCEWQEILAKGTLWKLPPALTFSRGLQLSIQQQVEACRVLALFRRNTRLGTYFIP